MLSQDDRRRLEAIERQLESDDPELARRLANWSPPRDASWATMAAIVVIVISALIMVTGVITFSAGLLLVGTPGLVGGWIWLHRRRRERR